MDSCASAEDFSSGGALRGSVFESIDGGALSSGGLGCCGFGISGMRGLEGRASSGVVGSLGRDGPASGEGVWLSDAGSFGFSINSPGLSARASPFG